jgi:segregation and condensation protein B
MSKVKTDSKSPDSDLNSNLSSIVAFVEDPFGLKTSEILDAQDNPEELPLDADFEIASPSVDEQLVRLAEVISKNSENLYEPLLLDKPNLAQELTEEQAIEQQAVSDAFTIKEKALSLEDEPHSLFSAKQLDVAELQACIEALLFISDKSLSAKKLNELLGAELDQSLFEEALQALKERYQAVHHGIELVEVAEGFQFRTKPGRSELAQKLVKIQTQRLSSGSMETLAIIAYKQPVMKEEIDQIRGVDSSYFIRHLIDRKLIYISGRSELPGRPILYATTPGFLEVFGLKDLSSLPSLRELEQMIPGSQTSSPDENNEDPHVQKMRKLVHEMKTDQSTTLYYDPKEDEKILKEIKERVTTISTSTPYLEALKTEELLAQQTDEQAGEQPEEQPKKQEEKKNGS